MRDGTHRQRQADVFGGVFLLAQHLGRRADRTLEPLGVTSRQWLLLAILVKRFAHMAPTLSEAAAVHGSSRQNVKQVALGLEAAGYVELRPDPEDCRALRLHVTRRAAIFDEPAEERRLAAGLDELFAGLTDRDVAELLRLLRKWIGALSPESIR